MSEAKTTTIEKKQADFMKALGQEVVKALHYLRIPLVLIGAFCIFPKLIALWTMLLLAYFGFQLMMGHLPASLREKITRASGGRLADKRQLKEVNEGLRLVKPFVYTALFFAAAPLSVFFMAFHWVKTLIAGKEIKEEETQLEHGSVLLKQNIAKQTDEETAFFHSRAFALTTIATVVLGIPTAAIVFLYSAMDIDDLTKQVSAVQLKIHAPYRPLPSVPMKRFTRKSAVTEQPYYGDEPDYGPRLPKTIWPEPYTLSTDFLHFVKYAYLMSIAWCLAVLFMRAYFTFPLNFHNTEYDIEIDKDGVRKHPLKGWFAEFLWYCWPEYVPRYYRWDQIGCVEYVQGGVGRLSPLPASVFSRESIVYKVLNKLATYTDALIDRLGRTEFISFDSGSKTAAATRISIRLWELSSNDKARLFYAIRSYAPHLYIEPKVQEKLIGSSVMKEPRYTEIWFDLLTSKQQQVRQTTLREGDTLCGGKYTIVEKLGTGGQASAFLAQKETGERVVVKEFILATGETFGALVESATDFENESSVLSRLDHPRIVKFMDIFAEERRAYIVMEYAAGNTLRQLVNSDGPISEPVVAKLAIQMCEILEYLHQEEPPVVHRDFTPENLILHEEELKVVDFSVSSRTGPHKSGDCVGKHSYTPPEQFRSQACPQSDIYALGATMHFLLTGSDPKPISQSDPRTANSAVSDRMAAIVMKATALDLNDRYEAANWLRLELEQLVAQSKKSESKPETYVIETNVIDTEDRGAVINLKKVKKKKKVAVRNGKKKRRN